MYFNATKDHPFPNFFYYYFFFSYFLSCSSSLKKKKAKTTEFGGTWLRVDMYVIQNKCVSVMREVNKVFIAQRNRRTWMRSDSQSRRDVMDLFAETCHVGPKSFRPVHGWMEAGSAALQNLPFWDISTLK